MKRDLGVSGKAGGKKRTGMSVLASLQSYCRCAYGCFTDHWDNSVMAVQTV